MTYKFFYNKDRNEVRIRLYNNKKKTEISLGIKISEEDFNNAMTRSPKPHNHKWHRVLSHYTMEIDLIRADLMVNGERDMDVMQIRQRIVDALFNRNKEPETPSNSFIAYYTKCADLKRNKSYKTSCMQTLDKIKEFSKNPTFEDITTKWLNEFDQYLIESGLSVNSRAIHFKNIRSVINKAIDEELTDHYPFRRFKIKTETTRKRSLTITQLRELISYDVQDYQEFYRDMFLLIFMLCGINTVDLFRLESITADGRIEYRRSKTKRLYSIKVEKEALGIIEKWKGLKRLICAADRWVDHTDFTKNMNIALKKIGECKIVGRGGKKSIKPLIPELSSYWARHTWATIASSLDIPKDTIAHALGHGTNSVTDIYIDFDQKKVDEANRKVLDYVLYGKV